MHQNNKLSLFIFFPDKICSKNPKSGRNLANDQYLGTFVLDLHFAASGSSPNPCGEEDGLVILAAVVTCIW